MIQFQLKVNRLLFLMLIVLNGSIPIQSKLPAISYADCFEWFNPTQSKPPAISYADCFEWFNSNSK